MEPPTALKERRGFVLFEFFFIVVCICLTPLNNSWRFNPIEPLSLLDLKEMEGRVKHMNIVSAAAGTFFQHKGLAPDQKEFASEHFREAIERYEESLEADPQDKAVLFFIALTWSVYHHFSDSFSLSSLSERQQ